VRGGVITLEQKGTRTLRICSPISVRRCALARLAPTPGAHCAHGHRRAREAEADPLHSRGSARTASQLTPEPPPVRSRDAVYVPAISHYSLPTSRHPAVTMEDGKQNNVASSPRSELESSSSDAPRACPCQWQLKFPPLDPS
jgi:hypothetical protein